jgi:hypothetical protein
LASTVSEPTLTAQASLFLRSLHSSSPFLEERSTPSRIFHHHALVLDEVGLSSLLLHSGAVLRAVIKRELDDNGSDQMTSVQDWVQIRLCKVCSALDFPRLVANDTGKCTISYQSWL